MPPQASSWLDRTIGFLAPRVALKRERARLALDSLRHYEGAAAGRRTQGWNRASGDANALIGAASTSLRTTARDLVRNNAHAESALTTIRDHVVGWGIVAKPKKKNARAMDLWNQWADTTACDSDGLNDFYGLQKLVLRTVVESGEVLIRRRFRLPQDNLPIPIQLQVLDPDHIDTAKTGISLPNGGAIINGIEFDPLGRRAAYWLFREHPGSAMASGQASGRINAENILHVFKQERPGQVRGASWFAPVLLRFKDFDEYEDATLMKQKIAACLAVITSDVDGSGPALGDSDGGNPAIDSLEPGMVLNVAAGRTITTVQPPSVREYADYSRTSLRAIATGLGVAYEDLTGDYSDVNFSSARMSRIRHWARVEDWRWRLLIPQFCAPAWAWAMQAAAIMGLQDAPPVALWTPPPMPMIEPDKEGLAYARNIRAGIMTLSEVLRERGFDPDEVLKEMAADNARLDELEIILDSDARNTTQAGNPRHTTQGTGGDTFTEPPKPPPVKVLPPAGPKLLPPGDDEDEEEEERDGGSTHSPGKQGAGHAPDQPRARRRPRAAEEKEAGAGRGSRAEGRAQGRASFPGLVEPGGGGGAGSSAGGSGRIDRGPRQLPRLLEPGPGRGGGGVQGGPGRALTARQAEVLACIRAAYEATGEPPSVPHIGRRLGLHHSTVQGHIVVLHEKGWLRSPAPSGLK